MKSILLLSGNVFYYEEETTDSMASGWVISKNNEFLGGYLGLEADKKYKVFRTLSGVLETMCDPSVGLTILSSCDKTKFAEKLRAVSNIFVDEFFLSINDLDDCDGTDSAAESCSDRKDYYKAVGMGSAYDTSKTFYLGLFIANHISVFSWEHFRETFFRGREVPEHDDNVSRNDAWSKWTYSNYSFKAPAAYVRSIVNNQ